MVVSPTWLMYALQVDMTSLFKPGLGISVANGESMSVKGGVFLQLQGKNPKTGEVRETCQTVYVSSKASDLYLSKRAMQELGIISISFPTIADHHTGRANMTRAKCNTDYRVGVADCVDVTEGKESNAEHVMTGSIDSQLDILDRGNLWSWV